MAFNPEVALFNLLEDAQTAAEVLQIIDDYIAILSNTWGCIHICLISHFLKTNSFRITWFV